MSCYKHLTTEERECILVFLAKGYSKRKIAEELHRSPSTISRELKRNKTYKVQLRYSPEQASLKYKNRRKHCHRQLRLKEPETYALVVSLLQRFWSPEQINHRLKLEQSQIQIGASTIYRGYKRKLFPKEMRICLRTKPYHKPGKQKRTGKLEPPHRIAERPEEANKRLKIGHWESDTVHGAKKTGYLCHEKAPNAHFHHRSRQRICQT